MGETGDLFFFFFFFVVCSASIICGWVVLACSRKSFWGSPEIMYMCDGPIETVECNLVNIWI